MYTLLSLCGRELWVYGGSEIELKEGMKGTDHAQALQRASHALLLSMRMKLHWQHF
jgi:hypothetical protein